MDRPITSFWSALMMPLTALVELDDKMVSYIELEINGGGTVLEVSSRVSG
jgi:hypothetical protein